MYLLKKIKIKILTYTYFIISFHQTGKKIYIRRQGLFTLLVHGKYSKRMVDWWNKENLLKFQSPTPICIVGLSNSGKTVYPKNLLQNAEGMFQIPPSRIFYCYGVCMTTHF